MEAWRNELFKSPASESDKLRRCWGVAGPKADKRAI
jgi:hypothetical protein